MRHISQWSHLEFICYPLFYLVSLIQSIIAGIIIFYFTTSDHRLLHFSMIDYIHGGKISPVSVQFSSVQSLIRVRFFGTPWTAACQASLSITNSQSPPKPTSIKSVMPSNHLILCRVLFKADQKVILSEFVLYVLIKTIKKIPVMEVLAFKY